MSLALQKKGMDLASALLDKVDCAMKALSDNRLNVEPSASDCLMASQAGLSPVNLVWIR